MNFKSVSLLALLLFTAPRAEAKEAPREVDPATGVYIDGDADVIIINGDSDVETSGADPSDPHVAFGGRNSARGGWGGIDTAITSINGQPAQTLGFRGGYMMGHRFTIGFAGAGIISYVEADGDLFKSNGSRLAADGESPHFVEGGYGGLLLQWEPLPRWVIHPNASATLGAGAVTYLQRADEDGWDTDWAIDADIATEDKRPETVFGVADLRAGGTLNMTRWARFDVHLGYRHIGGMSEFDGLSRRELGGFSLGAGLRFGHF